MNWQTIKKMAFLVALPLCLACTKVVVYGMNTTTKPLTHSYSTNLNTALQEVQEALKTLGYKVQHVNDATFQVKTGWLPVKGHSHYMDLFNRKDYSASSGSYYQLLVDMTSDGNKVNVTVSTTVKSVAGRLSSSQVVERQFLTRLDDLMRSPQIQLTNVGVTER